MNPAALPPGWAVIALADAPVQPWANGGGRTRELWRGTAAGGSDPNAAWTWRLSVADIEAAGPFSALPGVTRHIAVLDGGQVRLRFPASGAVHTLEPGGPVLRFDGGAPPQAEPSAPSRDLNWMLRHPSATSVGAAGGAIQPRDFNGTPSDPIAIASGGMRPLSVGEACVLPAGCLFGLYAHTAAELLFDGQRVHLPAEHALHRPPEAPAPDRMVLELAAAPAAARVYACWQGPVQWRRAATPGH